MTLLCFYDTTPFWCNRISRSTLQVLKMDNSCRCKMRRIHFEILLAYLVLSCAPSFAQLRPISVDVASLSKSPQKFDGRLVRIRAWLLYGWEGDNFLFDAQSIKPGKAPLENEPSVWFYCRPGSERLMDSGLEKGYPRVTGTFIGYFHFVPNKKGRMKDVFDPGLLQLEGIAATVDLHPAKR
jgi:hypothetical protein